MGRMEVSVIEAKKIVQKKEIGWGKGVQIEHVAFCVPLDKNVWV